MSICNLNKVVALTLTVFASTSIFASSASARPKYAEKEKVNCLHCHVKPGGDRNFRGLYYEANKLSFENFDEQFESKAAGVKAGSAGPEGLPKTVGYPAVKVPDALRFAVKSIDGKLVNLGRYSGSVVMVVNVASFCGNTPQYKSLQAIYDKYKDKGLVILGFPANEFGKQEPGTDKEIKEFCTTKYNVTFPMFSKVVVKGEGITPLYKLLTDKEKYPKTGGDIEWNFAKFLINRKGEVVGRYKAFADPGKTPDVVAAIEKEIAVKSQ